MLLCCILDKAQVAAQGRTGILLVHYGTQNDKSCAATIDLLNSRVASEFPDCRVREAYVAQAVVKALGKRGIAKLSVAQAMDSLKAEGCNRIVVQTTMLLDGVMTDIMYKIPSDTTANRVIITADSVKNGSSPVIKHIND